ncbi:hypothetical protein ACFSC4_00010 [Deinococcus malanensis]|uniref:hypothetical protein n=1 Tax=Deinococcus malanensis TaxID=1706855 RepID=UPI0036276678
MSDFSKLEALFNEQDLERRKAAEGEQQRLSHERAERGRDFDNLTAAVIAPMQELEGYLRSKESSRVWSCLPVRVLNLLK